MIKHDKCQAFEDEIDRLKKENEELRQGKTVEQVEGSAFFVGLALAAIISTILWTIIIRSLT